MTAKQISFGWNHVPSLRRSDFVISDCNQAALEWVESWPNWGSYGSIIWGPAASGKTHLAHIWAEQSAAVFLNSEIPEDRLMAIVLQSSNVILDNADQFGQDELLFHILNACKNRNAGLLLLAQHPASQWNISLPDLSSRLQALPQIAIQAPDDTMLIMLMTKLFADRQLQVDPGVIDFTIRRLPRTYAAVQGFVMLADQFSLALGRNITLSLAREVLSQMDASLNS